MSVGLIKFTRQYAGLALAFVAGALVVGAVRIEAYYGVDHQRVLIAAIVVALVAVVLHELRPERTYTQWSFDKEKVEEAKDAARAKKRS